MVECMTSALPQNTAFSNYYSGDPYLGSNTGEIRKKDNTIRKLKADIRRMG